MTELRRKALQDMDKLHYKIDYSDYSAVHDALSEIETLESRDLELEELWAKFADVPMNPETECMEKPFIGFPAGTPREEIWHWFDRRHSKGVYYLMYGRTETENEKALWDALLPHRWHNVRIVSYGETDCPEDVCLECEDCNEIILDAELYTLRAKEEN